MSLRALILAGGFGTRLRPITYNTPKPMIPVRNRPFLEYLLYYLKRQGLREIVLCLHYMPEEFIEYFNDGSKLGIHIVYSIEKEPLGTGGAIKNAEKFVSDTFLVMNGDTFLEFDLVKMLEFHNDHEGIGTIAIKYMKPAKRYGVIKIDSNWRILRFIEKAEINEGFINAGVYIFNRKLLDYIPKDKRVSLEKDILPMVLQHEKIYGFQVNGYFIDIGVPGDLYRFEKEFDMIVKHV